MSMTRGFTPEEADLVKKSMERVYRIFKKRVTDGRGEALKGDLEPLAGGRVYSGGQALEIGLVDEIGGLQEAIAHAAEMASLYDPETKLLPEPKSGIEGLFAKPDKDEEIIRAQYARTTASRGLVNVLRTTGVLPATAHAAVARLVSRLDAFSETRVLLLGPDLNLR
jgi:protease-4